MQEVNEGQTAPAGEPAAIGTAGGNALAPAQAPAGPAPEGTTGAAETPAAGTAPPPDSKIQNPDSKIEAVEQAAAELARVYRAMPGVVAELIGGQTIADVQATFAAAQRVYADVRAAVLRDLGAALPAGHAAPGAPPAPADPFGLIAAGLRK